MIVYQAVKHFRHFVEAKPFTVYTDHKPLTNALSSTAERSPRQIRQLTFISEFTTDIAYSIPEENTMWLLTPGLVLTMPTIDFQQLAADQ